MFIIEDTPKEAYDKVLAHLLEQGKPCIGHESKCLYRGPDNTSCAVGCMIPDNCYSYDMENKSVQELIIYNYIEVKNDTTYSLLTRLQSIHDDFKVSAYSMGRSWDNYINEEFSKVKEDSEFSQYLE